MKVYIRADASTQIGTGHVMRCLTLAGDLRHFGLEVSFISRVLSGDLCDYVENKGFKVHRINEEVDLTVDYWQWLGENWMTDAIKTREIILNQAGVQSDVSSISTKDILSNQDSPLNENFINKTSKIAAHIFSDSNTGWEWGSRINLVVDSYALDHKWEKFLRPHVNKIMVIDDLANRAHDCDLLLDQNYYRDIEHRYDGLLPLTCRKLLGPEYALLRPEFHQAKKTCENGTVRSGGFWSFLGGAIRAMRRKRPCKQ